MAIDLILGLAAAGVTSAVIVGWVGLVSYRALREPTETGGEGIVRREGVVEEWHDGEGWIIVDGERWRARSDNAIDVGDRVDVVAADGLTLEVTWARRRFSRS